MSRLTIQGGGSLHGSVRIPGDKSISHRSLIFNALSRGSARVDGLLRSDDVQATQDCLTQLGVQIEGNRVAGNGGTFEEPAAVLDCGNSGTTIRLLLGLLSGQKFRATLSGDSSLQARPMGRVIEPLKRLGANFYSENEMAPVTVEGGPLQNVEIVSAIASAQVKTAVLLAALQGEGTLVFEEPSLSRDHTERMFRAMGIVFDDEVHADGRHTIRLEGPQTLNAVDFIVPGDISSAAFFLVAASITPGSEVLIENVGVNPSRSGILDALQLMGGDIEARQPRLVGGEPVADLLVKSASLNAVAIEGEIVPRMIDEIPVLAVAMAHAKGTSSVRDAHELRVKESDRIKGTLNILRGMGVEANERSDGFEVTGALSHTLKPVRIDAEMDHRIAMSAIVAGIATRGETTVSGTDSIATSFPEFFSVLESLRE